MKIRFPLRVLRPIWGYLKREEKKLVKRKEDIKKEDPFADTSRLGDNAPDTDAAEQFGHARVSALLLEINKNLIRVRKALTRIKMGRYGVCKGCREMIDTDRLAADPTVEYCLKCKRKRSGT